MKDVNPIRSLTALILLLVASIPARVGTAGDLASDPLRLETSRSATMDLERGFAVPPIEAKPRVYWWWLNSQVTKEAITRDLEEMNAKGIGGALLFDAGGPAGPTPLGPQFMSDAWRDLFRHAVREADRLGVELSVNLCSGWDAGGPWITPEYACRRLAWSETTVTGPAHFDDELPLPKQGQQQDFRDVIVLAVPAPATKQRPAMPAPNVSTSSSQSQYPVSNVADGSPETFWVSDGWKAGDGPSREKPEWIQFEFPQGVDLSLVTIWSKRGYGPHQVEVQIAEDDAPIFKTVAKHTCPNTDEPQVIRFPQMTTRRIRLLITASFSFGSTEAPWNVQVREVAFHEPTPRLPDWSLKAARVPATYAPFGQSFVSAMESTQNGEIEQPVAIPRESVLDLTENLDSGGRFRWDVPGGRWVVLRFGHVVAGYKTHATSGDNAWGLEVDWLSERAMDFHFAATAGKLLEDAGPLAGKALRYFHDDSWEVGVPNWTDGLRRVFRRQRGYDPTPFLPALTGRLVCNREISERFLYDYRKTLADCLADNHYARFRDLCHRNGVLLHTEGGGPCTSIAPMDALRNLGMNDVPMGEFWQDGRWAHDEQNDVGKQTACAAHIYGKRFVAAEAFTSIGPHWEEGPADMKPIADLAFCEGINRFFHHTFTCSPSEFGKPGIEYFAGTHFNPNVTWWEQAGAFEKYLARCKFLLSQGLFVADVCYYYGDQAPNFVRPKHVDPKLGPGYDYDVCNVDVILNRMSVRDGRIVLPDGMSYRLLALPDRPAMPLEILRKLKDLVAAGATVVGPKPRRAVGLKDYPDSDHVVRRVADELWGTCDGSTSTVHRYGKGRIIWGRTLREVLRHDEVEPDFVCETDDSGTFLDFIHRSTDCAEVYFVVNRNDRTEPVLCSFRIAGRQPELWDPVRGTIRDASAFRQTETRTLVPLTLAPFESTFVVFRRPIAPNVAGSSQLNAPTFGEPTEIAGPWAVSFDPKWGGPKSVTFDELTDWTERPEPGIRYYSGTATYRKSFELPAALHGGSGSRRIMLELGVVKNVAEVRLNGRELGVYWTAPWRTDITGVAKPTGNQLEITVVNLWPNRLIGDQLSPPEERRTKTNVTKFEDKTKHMLLPSGLLGPVQIRVTQ